MGNGWPDTKTGWLKRKRGDVVATKWVQLNNDSLEKSPSANRTKHNGSNFWRDNTPVVSIIIVHEGRRADQQTSKRKAPSMTRAVHWIKNRDRFPMSIKYNAEEEKRGDQSTIKCNNEGFIWYRIMYICIRGRRRKTWHCSYMHAEAGSGRELAEL